MTVSSGDAHYYPIYNARFRVTFPILDADGDLVTGATGLDSELSQDGGTFADATNEATELATASGMYYLDLIATELDTKTTAIIVKTSSSGAKTTPMVLYPRRLPQIRTGTAQAGAASTITLDANASVVDDYYNGCFVNITNDTPSNALGQCRMIIDYVGSTKVATVGSAWGTNPSSSSTFEILLSDVALLLDPVRGLGSPTAIPNAAAEASGGLYTRGSGAGQINQNANGQVDSRTVAMSADVVTSAAVAPDAVTEIQSGLATSAAIAALNNLSSAQAQTAAAAALTAYDPPTGAELVSEIDSVQAQITALNNLSAAQVKTQADTALADIHLDHLLAADYDPANKPGVATALLNELIESDAGVSQFTANALEEAPDGSSAEDIWAYPTRTLTQAAAAVMAAVTGSEITVYRGTTWSISLTGLGDLSVYNVIYFTVKYKHADPDTAAVLQVKNDASGLLRFNQSAPVAATNGTVTIVDAVDGDITINVNEAETINAPVVADLYYDVKGVDNDGSVVLLSSDGRFNIAGDVTRAIA